MVTVTTGRTRAVAPKMWVPSPVVPERTRCVIVFFMVY